MWKAFLGLALGLAISVGCARAEDVKAVVTTPAPVVVQGQPAVVRTEVVYESDCNTCGHGFFHPFTHFWSKKVGGSLMYVRHIHGSECCGN